MDEFFNDVPVIEAPLLAIRGMSVFPEMSISFEVERRDSVAALEAGLSADKLVFLAAQRNALKEYPLQEDLYEMGVLCRIRQFIRTQSGGMRAMVEGVRRCRLLTVTDAGTYIGARVLYVQEPEVRMTVKAEAQLRSALGEYEAYLEQIGAPSHDALVTLSVRNDPGYTADFITQNVPLSWSQKQTVLETLDPMKRLTAVMEMLRYETNVLEVEKDIAGKLHEQLAGAQREHILREHIRVLQSELGEDDYAEIDDYRYKIEEKRLPKEVKEKLVKETERLAKQPFASAEASLIRTYLDTVLELPWNKYTKERLDLNAARRILDRDHFGLEKVKERIIEFLAVRCVAPEVKGGILCLVGPPGVGKTSIAISVATAMNRKLARMSLGGVHDEADIRGHRKTYIGAMPGRIMAAMAQAGSNNPLLLLDEIDKLGSDYRGDPASALLEALDPEQNATFRDHYLEIPYDLSSVMFIVTANTTSTIPRPLLDRMEVIELTSYTDEEKLMIAKDHLLPKQRKKHGLTAKNLKIGDDAIRDLISGYTRESGVRQLERELAALCRKADALIASGQGRCLTVTGGKLEELLGPRKYKPEKLTGRDAVGVVNGLAWTEVGGEILEVEVACLEGTGKIELTGNLGDVMKESAHAAVSYIRSRCDVLGIDRDFYKNRDIHIHFPEGAVPKDGPSAGITIACALISALTGVPARRDVAMTGEITVTGRILPIGGLREKTMAALRFGVRTVIIPEDNRPDLEEIDQTVRRALNFVTASRLDDILDTVLVFPDGARPETSAKRPVKAQRHVADVRDGR